MKKMTKKEFFRTLSKKQQRKVVSGCYCMDKCIAVQYENEIYIFWSFTKSYYKEIGGYGTVIAEFHKSEFLYDEDLFNADNMFLKTIEDYLK